MYLYAFFSVENCGIKYKCQNKYQKCQDPVEDDTAPKLDKLQILHCQFRNILNKTEDRRPKTVDRKRVLFASLTALQYRS